MTVFVQATQTILLPAFLPHIDHNTASPLMRSTGFTGRCDEHDA